MKFITVTFSSSYGFEVFITNNFGIVLLIFREPFM